MSFRTRELDVLGERKAQLGIEDKCAWFGRLNLGPDELRARDWKLNEGWIGSFSCT